MDDDRRKRLGREGEAAAEAWLRRAGMSIAARSFRARFGEIDLIALDGPVVVFVEVKTRSGTGFGSPAEAVTARKRRRMVRVAALYLARSGEPERACRFDVLEVVPAGESWRVRHVQDAFRPGD